MRSRLHLHLLVLVGACTSPAAATQDAGPPPRDAPLSVDAPAAVDASPSPDSGLDSGSPPTDALLAGDWQYVSGPLFSGAEIDPIQYLELDADATGTVFTRAGFGFAVCNPLTFAILDDLVVEVDIPDYNDAPLLMRYSFPDANTLELVDPDGATTELARVAAIPSAATCQTAIAITLTRLDSPVPAGFTGLVTDGTSLLYSDGMGGVIPIDPETGATGTRTQLPDLVGGQPSAVKALDGSNYWVADNNPEIELVDSSQPLEVIDVDALSEFYLAGAAFDGTALWLSGLEEASSDSQTIVELALQGSGATIETTFSSTTGFDIPVGMTFVDGQLWSLFDDVGYPRLFQLVELDPATGQSLQSYTLPRGYFYQGVAAINGTFYALRATEREGSPPYDLVSLALP